MSIKVNEDLTRTCNGEDFIIWKKDICSIEVDGESSEFKRLEFLLLENWGTNKPDYILQWLEPAIYKGEPALILHCSWSNKNDTK